MPSIGCIDLTNGDIDAVFFFSIFRNLTIPSVVFGIVTVLWRPGNVHQQEQGGLAMRVIDGDAHFLEPLDMFERYIRHYAK